MVQTIVNLAELPEILINTCSSSSQLTHLTTSHLHIFDCFSLIQVTTHLATKSISQIESNFKVQHQRGLYRTIATFLEGQKTHCSYLMFDITIRCRLIIRKNLSLSVPRIPTFSTPTISDFALVTQNDRRTIIILIFFSSKFRHCNIVFIVRQAQTYVCLFLGTRSQSLL